MLGPRSAVPEKDRKKELIAIRAFVYKHSRCFLGERQHTIFTYSIEHLEAEFILQKWNAQVGLDLLSLPVKSFGKKQ